MALTKKINNKSKKTPINSTRIMGADIFLTEHSTFSFRMLHPIIYHKMKKLFLSQAREWMNNVWNYDKFINERNAYHVLEDAIILHNFGRYYEKDNSIELIIKALPKIHDIRQIKILHTLKDKHQFSKLIDKLSERNDEIGAWAKDEKKICDKMKDFYKALAYEDEII